MPSSTSSIPRYAWILIALAVVGVVFAALFDWNWLRGPVSAYLSGKFGRPVAINGNLRGEFSLKPLLVANEVTLANTPWGTDPLMARAQEVAIRVDLLSLLRTVTTIPELTLVRPWVLLERNAEGNANWDFGDAPAIPRIDLLRIDAGDRAVFGSHAGNRHHGRRLLRSHDNKRRAARADQGVGQVAKE
jgi:uncharacterized protein involved in outer membrane biogenesis